MLTRSGMKCMYAVHNFSTDNFTIYLCIGIGISYGKYATLPNTVISPPIQFSKDSIKWLWCTSDALAVVQSAICHYASENRTSQEAYKRSAYFPSTCVYHAWTFSSFHSYAQCKWTGWQGTLSNMPSEGLSEPSCLKAHFDGLVQNCSNSSALAMGLLQSGTKPSTWYIIWVSTQQ